METINKVLLDEFLNYKLEYDMISVGYYELVTNIIGKYIEFLESQNLCLITVSPEDIVAYRKEAGKRMNGNTMSVQFAVIKEFYNWACHPTINKIERNVFPIMRFEKTDKVPKGVPTAKQIIAIRKRVRTVTMAAIIETYISSGMRVSELTQVRACDIAWEHRIRDFELGRLSPYIGGYIEVKPTSGIRTKGNRARTVFISKLAAKMIRKHMDAIGISADSNLPLFPYDRNWIADRLHTLGEGIVNRKIKFETIRRVDKFLDLDTSKISGSPEYLKKIKAAQDRERKRREKYNLSDDQRQLPKVKKIKLGNHMLRHFFACFQYYRNYYGNRHDLVTLRDMLGHSSLEVTSIYLHLQPVVTDDKEWRHILMGGPLDYNRAYHKEK